MRDLVRTRKFRIRKTLDEFLHKLMPLKWIPLYNSVTFTTMPYRKCLENRNWQDKVRVFPKCIYMYNFLLRTILVYRIIRIFLEMIFIEPLKKIKKKERTRNQN